MRILIANIPTPLNRYLLELKMGLENHAEVIWDYKEFWQCKGKYDYIHIHWPEYLSYEIEKFLFTDQLIPDQLILKTVKCLEFWYKNSTIIYTRHVYFPHKRQDNETKKLYEITLKYCKLIFHFAYGSIEQYKNTYPHFTNQKHSYLAHHNYLSLPNCSTKESARKTLGIDPDTCVMLVFGEIKEHEKKLINKAFSCIRNKNKLLLTPRWMILRRNLPTMLIRELVWYIESSMAKKKSNHINNLGFISEEKAHLYLNSADFLFIPRTYELNSGNIALAFSFGLVTVGSNKSNIGEILIRNGNPTFDLSTPSSLKKSISRAIFLSKSNLGKRNFDTAKNDWDIKRISLTYINTLKKQFQ